MTEVKRVKIQNFIETQIPEFLNVDNPLFKEFLNQYYISLEHQTGTIDLANNLNSYKEISNFNYETFSSQVIPQNLTQDVELFDTTINVNHTIGYPEKYGLLKIDNEIITYTSKTNTSFEGCIRGFSGIDNVSASNFSTAFNFSITNSEEHRSGSKVDNLNSKFFAEIFKKFRYQFIPGFENRSFYEGINLQTILSRAKDFYISKGTDTSYKILFKVLYGEDIEVLKPQDYMIRPSANNYFITKNILVEKVLGDIDPLSLKGYTLFQNVPNGLASATIYNVEVRPVANNKILYEISLDSTSFNLDFKSTKTTKVLQDVEANSNTIIVDNTVGFSTTSLLVNSVNSTSPFYISYAEKTINQFLNVTNVLVDLKYGDSIIEDNFAYVDIDSEYVKFRVLNIIESIDYSSTFGMNVGDTLSVSTFGEDLDDHVYFNKWIYNVPTKHRIQNIDSTSDQNKKRITLYDRVYFTKGEIIDVYDSSKETINLIPGVVTNVISKNTIEIEVLENISSVDYISKVISKCDVLSYPEVNNLISNIQNTYIDKDYKNLYVASSGLPDYRILADDRKIIISTPQNPNPTLGIAHTTILKTNKVHKFYPGEKVWVTPSSNLGLTTGVYYVSTIGNYSDSDEISLSYSNSDLFSKKYIKVSYGSTGELVKEDYQYKTLEHQKLLKKFPFDNIDQVTSFGVDKSTNNKPIGLLLNGVELYSSTLYDENIYYGKLNDVEITNAGFGYDIVNTPSLVIDDAVGDTSYGIGAKAHLNLSGSFVGVKIINPGSGYDNNLKISIDGGNGYGASLEANVIKDRIRSGFRGDGTGVNPTNNTINFVFPHNFEDGEIIEYFSNSNAEIEYSDPVIRLVDGVETIVGSAIRKLSENSFYFAGVINNKTIKLYRTKEDAANKINEINLTTSPSFGFHYFRSIESKNTLIGVSVVSPGTNYSNKKVIVPSIDDDYGKQNGINPTENYIFAKDHNFKDKDLIVYSTSGNSITGISTENKYYVKTIDKNRFKLSLAGSGNTITDTNYILENYVRIKSLGSGNHTFSYPPIQLKVEASLESSNGKLILPELEPIVLGSVENIFLESGGEKYGTPNIINFHRRPLVKIGNVTSEAIFKPLISNGSIIDVQILNYGSGYGKDVDLVVTGNGNFAEIYPVIENGKVVSVNVINGGVGYDEKTTITIKSRGSDAKFLANVFQWKINQVEKNKNLLQNSDEGILVPSKNQQDGLQFVHFYPPKVLRDKLEDNLDTKGKENPNSSTSPILGWSYDGFPIYGPYSKIDGLIQRSKSSYKKDVEGNSNLRPTGNMFPDGFFIQDYVYDSTIGDLDEYNGKYIKNEDFPEGTYAYFFTIDVDINNDSIPQYPYVISKEFKNHYDNLNYQPSFNQNIDLSNLNLIRNVSPYYLNSVNSYYGLIDNVEEKYNQDFKVQSVSSSRIDSISIYDPGNNYKVGDILNFGAVDEGAGAYATVSNIKGKDITAFNIGVSTSYPVIFTKTGNKIIGKSKTPLDVLNNDTVIVSSISNNSYKFLEGSKQVTILSKVVGITTDVPSIGITGNITKIYPKDVLGFKVDDYIKIDDEILRILQVIPENSSLLVNRISNSGVHTSGISNITLLPTEFTFFDDTYTSIIRDNTNVYFNPNEVVAIGNSGKTYIDSNSSSIVIPKQSIYIPNHTYRTGQPLTYNVGIGGTGLYVYENESSVFQLEDKQTVYALNLGVDFVGISTIGYTSTSGIGNTYQSLYFSSPTIGIGIAHSFTTQYTEIVGKLENYSIIVDTKTDHELQTNDIINLNITPNIVQTIKFRYDSKIRRATTELIPFNSTKVNLSTSEIEIGDLNLETGDKIVYYNNGDTTLGGLVDNETYFIIKTNPGKIRLANYHSDAISGNFIEITSLGTVNQSIAKINPKINLTFGNIVNFDLSDDTLTDVTMNIFKDIDFKKELETYKYILPSGQIQLSTTLNNYPRELYYNFSKSNQTIYPDYEVKNNNLIEIVNSNYNINYKVNVINDTKFKINLRGKVENLNYNKNNLSSLYYTTNSLNSSGPISKVKINSGGKGYKKNLKIKNIVTSLGENAVLKTKSTKIGKINSVERIKDGFDYPTDITLIPKLSVPAIVQLEGISRVDYVGIITGGINYNIKPKLKVIGNDDIALDPILEGTSIVDVKILSNVNNLNSPLRIVPTRNSNGYSINDIQVSGTDVTLELLNSDNQIYPLITAGYGSTEVKFPFSLGDEIFIERCRISSNAFDNSGNLIVKDNYNSSDYDYRFFTVTGISTENYTVTYSVDGITNNLGDYNPDFGYGYVINRKDMAEFEMYITNDLKYTSGEAVLGYNKEGTNTFSAKVLENGWDNDINELRLTNVKGTLSVGDILKGQNSLLNGTVTDVNIFNLKSNCNVTRDKVNDFGYRVGFLNDFQQRISDNEYYQKFSYSIQSRVPYNIWKESVKSIIHPSGFKEFSDLTVVGGSTARMKVGTKSSLDLTINIDNIKSVHTKNNFSMVTEEDQYEDGSIETVIFDEGIALKPYILSKSNKVISIDDISPQFTGTSQLEIVTNKDVTFISTDLYRLGVSTEGLKVGDKIGFSTYHFYPDSTYILSIGNNYIGVSSDTPHRLYSANGVPISITENLIFYRRVTGDVTVGVSSFKLTHNSYPLFYREFDASNGITTTINLLNNSFDIPEHNFHTGQKIIYTPQYQQYSAIAATTVGSGAILEPVFSGIGNSVSKINIINGGSGYSSINKPEIEIIGTKTPLLKATFNPLIHPVTGIITSIIVTNPGYGYFLDSLGEIGIVTTSYSEGRKDILMKVGGGIGSAIYENGYNVAISTSISGISSSIIPNFSGYQNRFWGYEEPYIPVKITSGSGINAKFSVFIVYNSTTGTPISTSIILRDGGSGYSIGDTVSIAGTYIGGQTPSNDLSFKVSKISSTRISAQANSKYSNIPAKSSVGYGTGAIITIDRNSLGDINNVDVVYGGVNYELTDNITIAGTYIGGSTPNDNLYLSPVLLGTNKLPTNLYVEKINGNIFKVAGLSTAPILELDSTGIGTHSFSIENPNVNSIIAIDNVIQTPIYLKNLEFSLTKNVSYNDDIVYLNSGLNSLVLNDILSVNDEYMLVKNVGVASTNGVSVERGILGTVKSVHSIGDPVYTSGGNYNIIKDKIYFTTPPYGPNGFPGLEINSSFSGRSFSRRSDPNYTNDLNIIFDDISNQFTGIAATEFILKSNKNDVVGIFTNTNSISGGAANVDINNNPIILINNIPQIGGQDYIIDTPGQNTIKFISGVPLAGKIVNIGVNTGFGYLPLVGASATVSVSAAGTISNVYLTGFGKGYRNPPLVSIASTIGVGASIISTIGVGGTVTSLTIINPGYGYTNTIAPEVRIDLPQSYYNLPLVYAPGYSGVGTGAELSVVVGNGSSIVSYNLDSPGTAYKVGDVLIAPGISTDPKALNFDQFEVTVLETFTDSFSGWYPGQFIQFDDISSLFNGLKKRFTLTVTIQGEKQVLSLRSVEGISMTDNLLVFVNDILQIPNDSYTFTGTRIIFKEAPKSGSKCSILFFKGSDLDVEQVEPIQTIKEGDTIQIDENIFDLYDRPQFDRIVKDIFTTDSLYTFTYDSIGISTDPNKIRPLNWTKQTQDKVINGVLYSKSRLGLKSKLIPSSKVIKDISKEDTKIYVDSAIPLFSDLDETRGLGENLRDVIVLNNKQIEPPLVKSVISYGSTISEIIIENPGSGYYNIKNPVVSISSRFITRKDPIYQWSSNVGIATTLSLNSIGYGTAYISVGNNGLNLISYDGENWQSGIEDFSNNDLSDVIGYNNNYVIVGDNGSVYKSIGISTSTIWQSINLLTATKDILGRITTEPSEYSGRFNRISYNPINDSIVAVGSSGGVFSATGITTSSLYENLILTFDFNSVANNYFTFVIVGQTGTIIYSQDGQIWNTISNKATLQNLNDVIWDGTKFIAVGNNSTIITSQDGINWNFISTNNINSNILRIFYHNGLYTILNSNGLLYFSLDLVNWDIRDSFNTYQIKSIFAEKYDDDERYISIGSSGFISYSTPVLNNAVAISTTNNGQLSQISIVNGGFGYSRDKETPIIIETDVAELEKIYSIKAKGDYGTIQNLEVFDTGNVVAFGTTTPAILFTLKSNNYPVQLPTMEYSQLEVGDYFVISNSNVTCGHALTGITTFLGGMSNYPNSKVGTTNTFIDGVYRVDGVSNSILGITTVRCHFAPIPQIGADRILINLGSNTTGFYGNYSFGTIYDYQNRSRELPKSFDVNTDNGLVGLETGPILYRTRGLI